MHNVVVVQQIMQSGKEFCKGNDFYDVCTNSMFMCKSFNASICRKSREHREGIPGLSMTLPPSHLIIQVFFKCIDIKNVHGMNLF